MFESQDRSGEGDAPKQNATDKRFFWLSLYAQPGLWVALAVVAILKMESLVWLSLIGELRVSSLGRKVSSLGSWIYFGEKESQC